MVNSTKGITKIFDELQIEKQSRKRITNCIKDIKNPYVNLSLCYVKNIDLLTAIGLTAADITNVLDRKSSLSVVIKNQIKEKEKYVAIIKGSYNWKLIDTIDELDLGKDDLKDILRKKSSADRKISLGAEIKGLFQLLKTEPENPLANLKIAQLYFDTGNHETALEYIDKVLSIEPGNIDAINLKVKILQIDIIKKEKSALHQWFAADDEESYSTSDAMSRMGDCIWNESYDKKAEVLQ